MGSIMLTIIAGVSVFVIGQFVLKLVLDPIVSLKIILGELSALFLREQAKITNANASEDIQNELKRLSSSILAYRQAIPLYRFFAFILCLPNDKSLLEASQSLNLVSYLAMKNAPDIKRENKCFEIHKEMKKIGDKLKIRIKYN